MWSTKHFIYSCSQKLFLSACLVQATTEPLHCASICLQGHCPCCLLWHRPAVVQGNPAGSVTSASLSLVTTGMHGAQKCFCELMVALPLICVYLLYLEWMARPCRSGSRSGVFVFVFLFDYSFLHSCCRSLHPATAQ